MTALLRKFHTKLGAWTAVLLSLAAAPGHAHPVSLAEAYQAIASRRFVDLTHAFSPRSPVWAGFGQASFTATVDPKSGRPYTIAADGFHTTTYSLVGQYGTHIDPPAHFWASGDTLDRIPVKQMILPLCVFDMTAALAQEPSHALTVADIEAWEKQHGRVKEGSFAALRTDLWKDFAKNPERFKRSPFPAWSLAAVRFLLEKRGVVAIGHESLDTDTTEKMESETWLLQHGHWQIEVMAHLDEVPATGALIVVSWPKVENGLGFPARAFAILP